jgi:hypothetical protein
MRGFSKGTREIVFDDLRLIPIHHNQITPSRTAARAYIDTRSRIHRGVSDEPTSERIERNASVP